MPGGVDTCRCGGNRPAFVYTPPDETQAAEAPGRSLPTTIMVTILAGFGVLAFLAFALDHIFRGAPDEIRVAELGIDPGNVGRDFRRLLFKPGPLRRKIDDAGKRQSCDFATNDELNRAGRRGGHKRDRGKPGQALEEFFPPACPALGFR